MTMKVGITGHQERKGIQWLWVKDTIYAALYKLGNVDKALSSLAAGSDQVFAEAALSLGIPVVAVIPLEGYEQFFKGSSLVTYRRLLSQSEPVHLKWSGDPERAFFEAGKRVVDESDLMFAVWDGEQAKGLGGTGDIVEYARQEGKPLIHIDPIAKAVRRR
jgi:hypothetical protein